MDNSLWEYNAPQFVDFRSMEDDENVEEYFNIDHENGGISVTLDVSEISTPRSNYNLRTSRQNTPQKSATPSRRSMPCYGTPGRVAKTPSRDTPTRAALVDSNALTPRRSNRIKSGTPQAEKKESCAEKENLDAMPTTSKVLSEKSQKSTPANLCTDLNDWNRRKPAASQRNDNTTTKRTGAAQKRQNESAPTAPSQSNDSHKRLRRSASSVITRPSTTQSESQKRGRSHSRSGSTQANTRMNVVPNQDGTDTSSSQVKPPISTNSAKAHVRTNSVQAKAHMRTNSVQAKTHVRTNSAQAKAHVRTNSVQSKTHVRSGSAHAGAHVRTLSTDRSRPVSRHERTTSTSSAPVQSSRSASRDRLEGSKYKPKITIPVMPAVLMHEQKSTAELKTTEQRELDQIKVLRKELALKRKMAEESLKKVHSSSGYHPVKSAHATTKPEGFNFATNLRIKGQEAEGQMVTEVDFASSLRHTRTNTGAKRSSSRHNLSSDSQKSSGQSITIPEPFKLHESKHRDVSREKYQSTAEVMRAFALKTPERFRTKPSNKKPTPPRRRTRNNSETKITVPKTPNLETRARYRPVSVISQAELDEQELEEIKKYKFKANPVNEKILKNPNCGLHKVTAKEPTKPEAFELEADRRIQERKDRKCDTEEHFEFHAKPVAKGILEGIVGIKPAKEIQLTKPASPAFALRNRLRSFTQQPQVEEETKHSIRANPIPHLGIPFQPKLSHKATEIQPFSFESRDKQMFAKKEEKILKVLNEEKMLREFHANPLPCESPDGIPPKQVKPPTVMEPFHMEGEHRIANRVDDWTNKVRQNQLKEEMRQQRAQANFKAKPANSIYKQPFMPKRSTKILTDVQEFELSTERRRDHWADMERVRYEKEAEITSMQMANRKRKHMEEEQEMKRLRSEAVHQAKPVRQYRQIEIKKSDRPLTQPETPRFSERLRTRVPDKS